MTAVVVTIAVQRDNVTGNSGAGVVGVSSGGVGVIGGGSGVVAVTKASIEALGNAEINFLFMPAKGKKNIHKILHFNFSGESRAAARSLARSLARLLSGMN